MGKTAKRTSKNSKKSDNNDTSDHSDNDNESSESSKPVAEQIKEQFAHLQSSLIETLFQKLCNEYDQRFELVLKENAELRESNRILTEKLDRFLEKPDAPPSVANDADADDDSDDDDSSFVKDRFIDESDVPYDYDEFTGDEGRNILILSDSMFRHVGVACPRDRRKARLNNDFQPPIVAEFQLEKNAFVKKIVIPGARAENLVRAGSSAAQHDPTVYDEVIFHAGTNYFSTQMPTHVVLGRIKQALLDLTLIYPESEITFSAIVPRCGGDRESWENYEIAYLNDEIERYCHAKGFGFFSATAFRDYENRKIGHLYAKDGTHLGRLGIENMQLALRNYIKFTYFY